MTDTNADVLERSQTINGIDRDALSSTIDAIREDPSLAVSRFRATNRWLAGNHNRTTVASFFAAKQDIPHAQAFDLDADEPPILAGNDLAPNPVEHLLHALASCLTTSMVAHAAVRNIPLRSVESEIEGDIDLNGYLGLSNDVPRGYTALRVRFKVDADQKYLGRLGHLAKFSPVFNTILNGAAVDVSVEPAS
jgi:uncharacterized OsmC-like protein